MVNPFYKYLDINGLKATLENGSLLFSRPTVFNDPFDMLIDNIFKYDPLENTDEHLKAFNHLMRQDRFPNVGPLSEMGTILKLSFDLIKASGKDQKQLEEDLLASSENLYDIEKLKSVNKNCLDNTREIFSTTGVLCGSKKPNNLLLWAHYTGKHTGGVIKFKPSLAKDSLLLIAQEVQYHDKRPFLYESPQDFIEKSLVSESSNAKFLSNLITLTKGKEWSYEEELRVCIPGLMDENDRKLLKYHDDEVEEVFIGCKTSKHDENEIVSLARARNPKVRIYKMKTSSECYGLTPVEIF